MSLTLYNKVNPGWIIKRLRPVVPIKSNDPLFSIIIEQVFRVKMVTEGEDKSSRIRTLQHHTKIYMVMMLVDFPQNDPWPLYSSNYTLKKENNQYFEDSLNIRHHYRSC